MQNLYPTLKKAKAHTITALPPEPRTLVEQYLEGKERQSKEQVVSNRKSRFSTPALPISRERTSDKRPCSCKGKCATRKCDCRATDIICDDKCKCKAEMCKNRDK